MSPEQADHQWLFEENLSCELSVPCRLDPGTGTSGDGAEMRLRAISLVEDGRVEDSEERHEKGFALQRIEAKLDLVLALCGQLLRTRQEGLVHSTFRLSSRGVQLPLPAGTNPPPAGTRLTFHFQAAEWLPDPVSLPVMVLAGRPEDSQHLLLKFDPISPVLQELMERHVFRLHRRHIAHQRHIQR